MTWCSRFCRISYYDNLRTYANCGSCRWELLVDGLPCAAVPITADIHTCDWVNPHRPVLVTGYCSGLSKGKHTLTVS